MSHTLEPGENEVALKNFWQALKGESYYIDNNKSLFMFDNGHHYKFFGLDDKPYGFYIRDCYDHLLDIALDRDVRNLYITGNPEIGKTFFGYYLLYILAQNDRTVIYEDYSMINVVILFSQEKVSYLHSILDNEEIQSYLYKQEVWYIVDGKTPTHSTAKTILICSPCKSHYTAFDKRIPTILFMPVWSWEEIDECRAKFFDHLSKERVLELYQKWGGVPRYILESANNPDTLNELEKAIELCDVSMLKYIGGSDSTDIISHKIVHIYTNLPIEDGARNHDGSNEKIEYIDEGVPYTKSTIKFASDYVGKKVTINLKATIINDLCRNIDAVLDGGKSDPVLGCFFEQIAHRILQNGGIFQCRSLDTGVERDINFEKLNSHLFSEIDDIKGGFYCQPLDKTFPAIDAIILPNILLQMTTTKKHSIKMIGLKKVQNKLARNGNIRFVFVVPVLA
ncbi:hypothetical protein RclHR1_05630010 [Rhizophagus clarus]|uniref:Uncharacterized protein n=1 Tax=Rhizophagus clarus TaxID=94130 RepID=A0A2Z6RU56_9GLOM|nr:hypothetical protein RclHR1_05630010 [Rhizophagus clarus]